MVIFIVVFMLLHTAVFCVEVDDPLGDKDGDGLSDLQEAAQALPICGSNAGYVPGVAETFTMVNGVRYPAIRFRARELPDLTFGYQVQESLDLKTWSDVDMSANQVTILNVPGHPDRASGEDDRIDLVTVRSNFSATDHPRSYLRVCFMDCWPPPELAQATVSLENLLAHLRENTLAILPNNSFSRKIYDEYSTALSARWARFSWTKRLNLSGVAFDSSRTCTLISSQHILMAAHNRRGAGSVVKFHARDGSLITRTITAVMNSETISQANNAPDVAVGRLDRAITQIPFYQVLPPRTDWPDYLDGALVLITRWNNREVIVGRENRFFFGPNGSRHISFLSDTEVPDFYEGSISSGDSGNPGFILIRGEPVLIHLNSFTSTRGPFLGDPEIQAIINGFMAELGGGSLTTVTLSQ